MQDQTQETQIPAVGQENTATQTAQTQVPSNKEAAVAAAEKAAVKGKAKAKKGSKGTKAESEPAEEAAKEKEPVEELSFDVKINRWGDMLPGSKARKALKAAGLSSEEGSKYLPFRFTIEQEEDGATGKVLFEKAPENATLAENQYLICLVSRNGSFYHKKAARELLLKMLQIDIDTPLRITYQKGSVGFFEKA
jgi:hypothetical protein